MLTMSDGVTGAGIARGVRAVVTSAAANAGLQLGLLQPPPRSLAQEASPAPSRNSSSSSRRRRRARSVRCEAAPSSSSSSAAASQSPFSAAALATAAAPAAEVANGYHQQAVTTNTSIGTAAPTHALVRHVDIYDTTLRDGSQMVGISLSVLDKLRLAELLSSIGMSYVEGGWPGSNPKDAEFFAKATSLPHFSYPPSPVPMPGVTQPHNAAVAAAGAGAGASAGPGTKLAAFGSTRYKNTRCEDDANVASLLASGAPVVTLVAKAWDEQVMRVLETTLEENLAMIADTIAFFKERGKEVMLDAEHFFDGYRANPEYAVETLQVAAAAGADVVVLCDTNGGTMPWQVNEATRHVVMELQAQGMHTRVGIHTHNDCDMAVANSVAAVEGGATLVQGCVNGYGERTGNANIVSVIGVLQVKLGYHCLSEAALARLTEVAEAVAEVAGQPMNASQPFVGANAFAHKGGIHVAAIRKMPESYNHCDPVLVGNSMRTVVSDLAGRGNILDKAERAGLHLDRESAGKVLARIKRMESEGFAFENASASVDMMIVRRGKDYMQPFRVLEFSVIATNRGGVPHVVHQQNAEQQQQAQQQSAGAAAPSGEEDFDWVEGGSSNSQAIVKVRVHNTDRMSAAEGNGPVDALSHALRASLRPFYPQLEHVELVDYRVRLVEPSGSRCGTQSTTRVTIDFSDQQLGHKWTTVGAHTSIVEASFRALVDGLEFGITHCTEAGCMLSQ